MMKETGTGKFSKFIETTQNTREGMEVLRARILNRALQEEMVNNWNKAITNRAEKFVEGNANTLSSHVLYQVKLEETDGKRMKVHICLHGIGDIMKGKIKFDAASCSAMPVWHSEPLFS